MVNRVLLNQFDPPEDDFRTALAEVFHTTPDNPDPPWLPLAEQDFQTAKMVQGRVRHIAGDLVAVDVGYKSEGLIPLQEWYDDELEQLLPPRVGSEIAVVVERDEDDRGAIVLSYRKAVREKKWQDILSRHGEGDRVHGKVTRRIPGGLLVNIGIPVFLPISQIDIRRPADPSAYLGQTIECQILKIDAARRNIIVSRRRLLETERQLSREQFWAEVRPGQVRKGVVKNIAEFGAFVDLGCLEGLLHITDMSWSRLRDPHQVVHLNQELEVYILSADRERQRIALSLKHLSPSPWDNIATSYPVGSRHRGEVVSLMTYGAFVKLESGVEGLVHISEMSWTRRINHPSELVALGEQIQVQVLNINQEKQEISLGIKQLHPSPWDRVAERYPPGTWIEGVVRHLTNYGAFIEIEEGIDGLLHCSDMRCGRKVSHPSEVLQKGDKVRCVVLNVNQERQRIALGLQDPEDDVPEPIVIMSSPGHRPR